jgi:hypothetical protein
MASCATTESVRFAVFVTGAGAVESLSVTTTVLVPAAVGAPLIAPVDVFSVKPAGRPVADHVYGAFPPDPASVAAYAVLTAPPGSEVVVMASTGAITSARVLVAVVCAGLESLTVMETLLVPPADGVPLIAPVLGFRVSPPGSPVADHVYGPCPPAAANVPAYGTPATPLDRAVVVTVRALLMVSVRLLVADARVGLVESWTVNTTVLVPAAVGVPVIAPVEAFTLSPTGSPVADQE